MLSEAGVRDAACAITEHLTQLGHLCIGFLWGGRQHRSSPERYQGYEDALKHYGIALDRKLIVPGVSLSTTAFAARTSCWR